MANNDNFLDKVGFSHFWDSIKSVIKSAVIGLTGKYDGSVIGGGYVTLQYNTKDKSGNIVSATVTGWNTKMSKSDYANIGYSQTVDKSYDVLIHEEPACTINTDNSSHVIFHGDDYSGTITFTVFCPTGFIGLSFLNFNRIEYTNPYDETWYRDTFSLTFTGNHSDVASLTLSAKSSNKAYIYEGNLSITDLSSKSDYLHFVYDSDGNYGYLDADNEFQAFGSGGSSNGVILPVNPTDATYKATVGAMWLET